MTATTTMAARVCPITDQPIGPDRYAAPAAAGRLRATLVGLPDLMAELETTITRQLRMSGNGAVTDDRLPFNAEASERAWVLRQTLLVWADELARQRREVCPRCDGEPGDEDPALCEGCEGRGTVGVATPDTWPKVRDAFTAWADWMTTTEAGAQAIDEILDAHHHALRAIDRPADRTYAGPCPTCHGDIYGVPGNAWVRCTTCGTELDAVDARQVMLDKLATMALPAPDAARAASLLTGVPVTAAQIRKWKHRGTLTPASVNVAGQPMYDLEHVVRLVNDGAGRIGS
ncbi:hypothetical protein [Georgenia faecalis]|uniref:hypothetical protein n=1 Tax=Georgenia faecalis TaxID=2483799 RepID=UPI000FDCD954|nr:hypothetical protein [Georgenia faecalis]